MSGLFHFCVITAFFSELGFYHHCVVFLSMLSVKEFTCSVFASFAVVDGEPVELVELRLEKGNREGC